MKFDPKSIREEEAILNKQILWGKLVEEKIEQNEVQFKFKALETHNFSDVNINDYIQNGKFNFFKGQISPNDKIDQQQEHQNSIINQIDLFQEIFKENTQQKKNTNFPKFLIANFMKFVKTNRNLISNQHMAHLKKSQQVYLSKGPRYVNIQALEMVFGNNYIPQEFSKKNRRLLFELFGSSSFKQEHIFESKTIRNQNRKQHLLASKIFRLRCRSSRLVGRVQTK